MGKAKKIKSAGFQMFNIPNTPEGEAAWEIIQRYKNKKFHFRRLGRGSRLNGKGQQSFIPVANSEWHAVYCKEVMDLFYYKRRAAYLERDNGNYQAERDTAVALAEDLERRLASMTADRDAQNKKYRETYSINQALANERDHFKADRNNKKADYEREQRLRIKKDEMLHEVIRERDEAEGLAKTRQAQLDSAHGAYSQLNEIVHKLKERKSPVVIEIAGRRITVE